MLKKEISKKMTKNGDIVNIKISPNIKDKYEMPCNAVKCPECGTYFDPDLSCVCNLS